ncbi:MAG: DUF433 domain-containing protein [Candidatus Omnitrophota bacterium]
MINFVFPNFCTEEEITKKQINKTTTTVSVMSIGGIYTTKTNTLADETALRSVLITKNPNICQGKPIILGTRISVSNIVELHYLLNWNIQKIRDEYPHLSNEQIIAALEYYENHTKEIDSYLQEEKEINAAYRDT